MILKKNISPSPPPDIRDAHILIIGAGPAGCSTALHLHRYAPHLAARTLILEKARHPRPKLCAGGLVVDAEVILKRLDLNVSEIPYVDVKAVHFDFGGRGLTIRAAGGGARKPHALRIIRRDEFDAWLAKKTESRGIEIREGVTVRNVQPRDDRVMVETDAGTFCAQVVIGADGSNGIVRRCVLPEAPVHTARVLEVLVQPNQNKTHKAKEAYFDLFPIAEGIAGYVWDFPTQVKDAAMRCWGVYDANRLADVPPPVLKSPLAEEMARHRFDLSAYKLEGYPIRCFHPFGRLSVPGVILVGDAAGADSLLGEGISMALGYGQVAARAIQDAFERGDFSFRDYRRRLSSSPLGQALAARWLFAKVVYTLKWRWFQMLLWRILNPLVVVIAWASIVNWAKRTKPQA